MTHKTNASESRARDLFPYLVGGDGVYHPVMQPSSPRVFVVPATRCTYSHTRIRPWRNISVVMLSFRQRKRRGRLVCTKSTPLRQRPGVLQSGLKRARSPTSIHCSGNIRNEYGTPTTNTDHSPERQVFHEFVDGNLVQQDEIADTRFVSSCHYVVRSIVAPVRVRRAAMNQLYIYTHTARSTI